MRKAQKCYLMYGKKFVRTPLARNYLDDFERYGTDRIDA